MCVYISRPGCRVTHGMKFRRSSYSLMIEWQEQNKNIWRQNDVMKTPASMHCKTDRISIGFRCRFPVSDVGPFRELVIALRLLVAARGSRPVTMPLTYNPTAAVFCGQQIPVCRASAILITEPRTGLWGFSLNALSFRRCDAHRVTLSLPLNLLLLPFISNFYRPKVQSRDLLK